MGGNVNPFVAAVFSHLIVIVAQGCIEHFKVISKCNYRTLQAKYIIYPFIDFGSTDDLELGALTQNYNYTPHLVVPLFSCPHLE